MPYAVAIFCRLEIEGSGKTWTQDQRIRLQHVDTGGYLHSHDKKYTRIAGGQQEVMAGILGKKKNTGGLLLWFLDQVSLGLSERVVVTIGDMKASYIGTERNLTKWAVLSFRS